MSFHKKENGVVKTEEPSDDEKTGDSCCRRCCGAVYPSGFKQELLSLLRTTWPIVLTQIGQMTIGPLSLMFCGHLGDPIQLDGAALAISMINTTCIVVGQGLGTACDTFFSQSFGSKNKKQVGVHLQRAVCIFLLALLPCYAIHINMETFLVLMGQNPEVARLTGRYMIIFMPGALNIVIPNVVIGIVVNLMNAGLHYLFLYQLNWSIDGSAIAHALSYIILFLLTLAYILGSKVYEDTWDGWSLEGLRDWGKFARLSIPGMLMVCMEGWSFEIAVALTGLLGTTELGAQSVLLELNTIWFQVPLGIQIACAIRIGQHLGAGNALGAKTAAHLCITINMILSVIVVGLFLGLRFQLAELFTNVEEVVDLTAKILPILAVYLIFDSVAISCKGVLYGTGRQLYGTALVFVSYYLLALPSGVSLMFLTGLRSTGYWWAVAGNLILQSIVLFLVVFFTNWEQQVERAKERAGFKGEPTENNPGPVTDEEKQCVIERRKTKG